MVGAPRCWFVGVVLSAATVANPDLEASCPATGRACAGAPPISRQHHWPQPRGRVGRYSTSPHVGPRNLSASLAWTWHHPGGRFHTVIHGGPLIDEAKNVYLASVEALRKFDAEGRNLWNYTDAGKIAQMPSLLDNALYASSVAGLVFSLDTETGKEIWKTRVADSMAGEISSVCAHDGVVLAAAGAGPLGMLGGSQWLVALNATTGERLWDFKPDAQLWNFMAIFTDNGTFVFQDQIGGVYHLGLQDGRVLWKSGIKGSWTETWCDGGANLGPNGIVYAVNADGPLRSLGPDLPGSLRAYRLSDGHLLWRRNFSHPPMSWPAVARLRDGAELSVVMPVGAQAVFPQGLMSFFCSCAGAIGGTLLGFLWCLLKDCRACCGRKEGSGCGSFCKALASALLRIVRCQVFAVLALGAYPFLWVPTYRAQVWAFNAETGDVQWLWEPPVWMHRSVRGDAEGMDERFKHATQPLCIPNPWASATVDAAGTVFTGYMNGKIYAIKDADGDGKIDSSEVDEFDAGAAFSHPGVAMAPGMLAMSTCDTLHVFRS